MTESEANYRTGGTNNYYGYSNPTVDALFDELQIATDPEDQERILARSRSSSSTTRSASRSSSSPASPPGTEKIGNVAKLTITPTIFYGFWEWTAGEAAAE